MWLTVPRVSVCSGRGPVPTHEGPRERACKSCPVLPNLELSMEQTTFTVPAQTDSVLKSCLPSPPSTGLSSGNKPRLHYKALLTCPCPPLPIDRMKPQGPCDPSQANQSLSPGDVQVEAWERQRCRRATQLPGQQPDSSMYFGKTEKAILQKMENQADGCRKVDEGPW